MQPSVPPSDSSAKRGRPKIPKVPPITAETLPLTTEIVRIQSGGTAAFCQPVDMLPNSPMAVLNNLLCAEAREPSTVQSTASPLAKAAQSLLLELSSGADLQPFRSQVEKLMAAQQERSAILAGLVHILDVEAYVMAVISRNEQMHRILTASRRGEITSTDSIVIFKENCTTIKELKATVENPRPVDAAHTLTKISSATGMADPDERLWDGSTPQGREIIRKRLYAALRETEIQAGAWETGMPKPEPEPDPPVNSVLDETAPPIAVTLANPP